MISFLWHSLPDHLGSPAFLSGLIFVVPALQLFFRASPGSAMALLPVGGMVGLLGLGLLATQPHDRVLGLGLIALSLALTALAWRAYRAAQRLRGS